MKLKNSFLAFSFILILAGSLLITPNSYPQDKIMTPQSGQFYSQTTNQNNPMLTTQQPAPQQNSLEKTQVIQELNQARESNDLLRQNQAELRLSQLSGSSMQTQVSGPAAQTSGVLNTPVQGNGDFITAIINPYGNWSIATATVPAGAPNAGRIWAVTTQYSATGSDTMRFYYSDNGGSSWFAYTYWYYLSYNMNYRANELDLEVVYDGTNVFLFAAAGFSDPTGRALCNLARYQVTGTFSFTVSTLLFPGNATATNQYYNPRITSDNISYPNTSVYLYITTSFDSTTGSTHFLRQKELTVWNPTTATPTYNYSNAVWWNGSGYPTGAYYFNDIAYYRTTSSSTTNRIMTLIGVNMIFNNAIYLAWSDDYGATIGGSLVITETAPIRGERIAASGLNTATDLMIVYLRAYLSTNDWDVAYQWTTTGGTTTGAWTQNYIDFTTYHASGYPDVIAVRGTTNQFKAAYNEDSSGVRAFYSGWNGTAWSTPSRLSINSFPCDTVFGMVRAGYKNGGGDDCFAIYAGTNPSTGGYVYSANACQTTTGIINNNNEIPHSFALQQNYPNPFNPSTVIRYSIPQNSAVKLTVYDITGRAVKTLVNQTMTPGNYEVNFDASNIASGIYFYKLEAGSFVQTKKMTLIK